MLNPQINFNMKATKSIIMTSKTIAAIVIAMMLGMLVSSCIACDSTEDFAQRDQNGFRSSKRWGGVTEKSLDLKDFTGIETLSSADIIYTQGDEFKVTVKGNEKAIEAYDIEVSKKGILTAKSHDPNQSAPTILVCVTAPTLNTIDLTGSGDIDIRESVNFEGLSIKNVGSGDIYIHDITCKSLNTKSTGSGDIKFGKLSTEEITSSTLGSGDIDFKKAECTGKVILQTLGSGDIDGRFKAEKVFATSHGSGDIDIDIDCKEVEIESKGSGEVEVEGYTDVLYRHTQGLGLTTTKELHAKEIKELPL